MRFWVGMEVEGRYKGVRTLFVQSSKLSKAVFDKINKILETEKVGQIYFGAGSTNVEECSDINCLDKLRENYLLSIESTVYYKWFDGTFNNIILTRELPAKMISRITLKVKKPDFVYCAPLESSYVTDLKFLANDMFAGVDKEIKMEEE